MSEWISIDDKRKPEIDQPVLIRIPVVSRHNIESAKYAGQNQFYGAWCDRRGDGCTYKVSHWMPRPEEPES